MDLFFNELSIKNRKNIDNNVIVSLVDVYKELLQYNITTCRISSIDNTRLFQLINNMPNSVNIRNFYFAFFKSPYESELVEKNQDEYYEHSWTYNNEECIGFALAFLLGSASLSIYSADWNTPFIDFLKDRDSNSIRNICAREHVRLHIPQIQQESEAEPLKCNLQITDKKIVLRHDHGMDVLEDFSKRLIRSPYIIGVINSLPYNPHERRFIKRIRENGLIEIVLPWTDEGYGIIVKTTGRTVRETERIADIINEEFGYI